MNWERDEGKAEQPEHMTLWERLAIAETKIKQFEKTLQDLVTRPEFTPVKLIAYGIATAVLAAVIAALLAQVIHK